MNKTVTCMFRGEFDWIDFARLLRTKYTNVDKINITDYGCSDGSEANSLAISIMEFAPEIAEKIFPIVAKDKLKHILDYARSGVYNIYNTDLYQINHYTKNKFDHYFTPVKPTIEGAFMGISPKAPLQNKIIYQQADILEDLQNLPDENNVVLCRNFWPYLGKENFHELAEKLYDKTKDNGLVVIGALENGHGVPSVLLQHGFRHTCVPNVYVPVKKMTV